jgi:hypothetical protein
VSGDDRARRLQRVVHGVCSAALAEAGASGLVLLEPDSPEGTLLAGWLAGGTGDAAGTGAADDAAVAGADAPAGLKVWRERDAGGNVLEQRRAAGALVAHPANRTVLLLSARLPLADLLPLGDVWASQVALLAGAWSAPAELRRLADEAGGCAALDEALHRLVDRRYPPQDAVQGLPPAAAAEVLRRFDAGRYARLRPRLVPKLADRTLGIDLFD